MKPLSYEARVAKMKKPGDEREQLHLAKKVVQRLRLKSKAATSLAEKTELLAAEKLADSVVRSLRLNSFDLEDMLAGLNS